MRRPLLALVASLAAVLSAFAVARAGRILYPGSISGSRLNRNPVVLRIPFFATGGSITEDANTVSHVTWNGNALVDSKGLAWTQNGTVPQVITGPFYPQGFSGSPRAGAGPFSTSNYYFGTGINASSSAPVSVCITFSAAAADIGTNHALIDSSSTSAGWGIVLNGSSSPQMFDVYGAFAYDLNPVSNAIATGGPSIFCGSIAAGSLYAELNGGPLATVVGHTFSAAASELIGKNNNGNGPWAGDIYEMIVWSEDVHSQFSAIEQRYLGQTGSFGEPLSVTRATTATEMLPDGTANTCQIPPCLFTWPAGVARVSKYGVHVEGASTNLVDYYDSFDNAAWTKSNTTVTADSTVSIDGTQDADTLTSTLNGGYVQSSTATAAAALYTVSVWVKGANQSFQYAIRDVTAGTSSCVTSGTATGTWQRFTCSLTSNATNGDTIAFRILPGGAGTGTIIAAQAQMEQGGFPTSVIPTAGSAATRNIDVLSYPDGISSPLWTTGDWSVSADAILEGISTTLRQPLIASSSPYAPFIQLANGAGVTVQAFALDASGDSAVSYSDANKETQTHYSAHLLNSKVYMSVGSTTGTGVASGTAPAEPVTVYLGTDTVNVLDGWISNICVARNSTACATCQTPGCIDP